MRSWHWCTLSCVSLVLTAVAAAADMLPAKSPFHLRIGVEQLRNPFWYEAHGSPAEAKEFWDKQHWERAFRQWAGDGYNAGNCFRSHNRHYLQRGDAMVTPGSMFNPVLAFARAHGHRPVKPEGQSSKVARSRAFV